METRETRDTQETGAGPGTALGGSAAQGRHLHLVLMAIRRRWRHRILDARPRGGEGQRRGDV